MKHRQKQTLIKQPICEQLGLEKKEKEKEKEKESERKMDISKDIYIKKLWILTIEQGIKHFCTS